jgi:hypothetical protein
LFLKKQKLQFLPRYVATTVKKLGKITVYGFMPFREEKTVFFSIRIIIIIIIIILQLDVDETPKEFSSRIFYF